jgi:hypothetical protein|tara:strand:- start:320 stop:514 length:195 start_codon:yes stop_codon:yes gene_type:complete
MIVKTVTLIIIYVMVVGCVIWTTPEPCPRKYKVLQENGGMLAKPSDIHRYCDLDYGGNWKIKDK